VRDVDIVTSMHNEEHIQVDLLEVLREEIAKLLVADDVSEEEKLSRLELARQILNGEILDSDILEGSEE
jgi:hypothetical protein